MDAALSDERGGARPSRLGALVLSLAMFGAYMAILNFANRLGPVVDRVTPPPGAPALWWAVDKKLTVVCIADLVAAFLPVLIYCAVRGRRLADLGFNRPGTLIAWALMLIAQAALVGMRLAGPLVQGVYPFTPYALYASAIAGFGAAFAEETFFRGYLMEQLRRGGFGPWVQSLVSMVLFGLAHYSYAATDPYGWTIPVFTGLLGGFWSMIYLVGKRSLWPVLVAHVINDAVVIPLAYYTLLASHPHF
jgi:membrane protease YdiL (CAAX protease family)